LQFPVITVHIVEWRTYNVQWHVVGMAVWTETEVFRSIGKFMSIVFIVYYGTYCLKWE